MRIELVNQRLKLRHSYIRIFLLGQEAKFNESLQGGGLRVLAALHSHRLIVDFFIGQEKYSDSSGSYDRGYIKGCT